ncbi:MAG TPA: baseplate assembly protein [Kaistiaceae bacterium]|nr:baseplate assembly protein [Kaistiaceae bacterium]
MRTGVDATTGQLLEGWSHVVQSLGKIVRTRVNTRTFYRHLGSNVPDLQDANANPRTLFELYVALAEAIEDETDGEPGFRLDTIEMVLGGRDGRFAFELAGDYFPRGHLGDFTLAENKHAIIPMSSARVAAVEVGA